MSGADIGQAGIVFIVYVILLICVSLAIWFRVLAFILLTNDGRFDGSLAWSHPAFILKILAVVLDLFSAICLAAFVFAVLPHFSALGRTTAIMPTVVFGFFCFKAWAKAREFVPIHFWNTCGDYAYQSHNHSDHYQENS